MTALDQTDTAGTATPYVVEGVEYVRFEGKRYCHSDASDSACSHDSETPASLAPAPQAASLRNKEPAPTSPFGRSSWRRLGKMVRSLSRAGVGRRREHGLQQPRSGF